MDEMRTALEKAVRLAGDNQYLQQREDEAEAVRSRTALPPLSEDKVTDPLVLRIVAYLKENYRSKITLADLQEQFHYSERYINQKFQKELGTTVIDYLNRCRIQNALELIRKGKLPISQIGWECGIGEYKYFNHVFKKIHRLLGAGVSEHLEISVRKNTEQPPFGIFANLFCNLSITFCARGIKMGLSKGFK